MLPAGSASTRAAVVYRGAFNIGHERYRADLLGLLSDIPAQQRLARLPDQTYRDRVTLPSPALLAVSMAVLAVLRREGGLNPETGATFVAGHSLGEYSALAAAGALSLAAAARTLRARGEAMGRAAPAAGGTMAAVLGAELSAVEAAASDAARETGLVCVVANDNAPGQAVLSGHEAAVAGAEALCARAGARRSVRLDVAGAFHSPLMETAQAKLTRALDAVSLAPPVPPVVANVTARPESDPGEIRGLLVRQLTERVRWRETVQALAAAGVDTVAEIGAGKVLCGLVRRTEPGLATASVETPQSIDAFLAGR